MKYIGAHVHIEGGVQNAPLNAQRIGARCFAMFSKNQRIWKDKPLESATIDAFHHNMEQAGLRPEHVLVHDSYLINLGNPDKEKRTRARAAFTDELKRCAQLGLKLLNAHPGSHLGALKDDECLKLIAEGVNHALDKTEGVTAVLENTAGQGSYMGYRFEQLATVIDAVQDKSRVGVCLDTCHAFSAGYDLKSAKGYRDTMKSFESTVGFGYLRGVHLNDSATGLGSRKDRHRSLGKGELGLEPFRRMMADPRFDDIPLVLETDDEELWPEEIAMLYGFAG